MKKIILFLICVMCLVSFSSCKENVVEEEKDIAITETEKEKTPAPEKEEEKEVEEAKETPRKEETAEESKEVSAELSASPYNQVIQNWYDVILNGENSGAQGENIDEIKMIVSSMGLTIYDDYGYSLCDVNGDGNEELLIGRTSKVGDEIKNSLNAVYGMKNGSPYLVYIAFNTNTLSLREDGSFYVWGRGSAVSYGTGVFDLASSGEISYREYYFTDMENDSVVVYKNTVGEMDTSISEKTDMTMESFDSKSNELSGKHRSLVITPFSTLMEV